MALGKCKMCLKTTSLVSSHLMPRLLYDYCRKGEHRPIKYGDGVLIPTDRQTQDHLLCQNCEDVLNQGGEGWIADKLATWERQFPLYELLIKVPAAFDEDGMAVYMAAQNSEIETQKLSHFALGIFWKASVHSWKGDGKAPRIQLGLYSEKLRRWLLGETEYPEHVYLLVMVERPKRAQITMVDPYEGVRQGWRTHFFHVPGILFMLALGKTVSNEIGGLAISSSGNPISISETLTNDFEMLLAGTVRRARKTSAYLKARAKVDADRRRNS